MHPLAAGSGSNAALTVLGIILIVVGIVAYWIPTIVGVARRKDIPNFAGVIIINALLGWTVIGWIVALVMAVKSKPKPVAFAPGPYGYAPPPQQPPQTWPQPTAPQPPQWQDPRQP
jgi:hypothetical protein